MVLTVWLAFKQEKALVGASPNLRLELYPPARLLYKYVWMEIIESWGRFSIVQEVLVRSLYPIHYINCPDSLYCNENNTLIIVQHSCGLLKYQLRQKIINHCCVFTPTCHGWIFCHKIIFSFYLLSYWNTHCMKTKIYENYCPKIGKIENYCWKYTISFFPIPVPIPNEI